MGKNFDEKHLFQKSEWKMLNSDILHLCKKILGVIVTIWTGGDKVQIVSILPRFG